MGPERDRGRVRCRDGRRGRGGVGRRAPRYSHLQDAVPLAHPGPVGRPPGQHGAHMLQRRVQLPVDAPQLPALAHLAPHVEAVAGLGLDDAHDPRAAASPAAVPGAVEPGPPTAAATPRFCEGLRGESLPRPRPPSCERASPTAAPLRLHSLFARVRSVQQPRDPPTRAPAPPPAGPESVTEPPEGVKGRLGAGGNGRLGPWRLLGVVVSGRWGRG